MGAAPLRPVAIPWPSNNNINIDNIRTWSDFVVERALGKVKCGG